MEKRKLNDSKIFYEAQKIWNNAESTQEERNKAWVTMFKKVKKCCDVQIRKWLDKSLLHIDNDLRDDYSSEATLKIMNRYKKAEKNKKQYEIKYIVEVCRLATMGELYNKKEQQNRDVLKIGVIYTEDYSDLVMEDEVIRRINIIKDDNEDIENGEYF